MTKEGQEQLGRVTIKCLLGLSSKITAPGCDATGDFDYAAQNRLGGLNPRTIVVATNIASRGVDLNIKDIVKELGGLHVLL